MSNGEYEGTAAQKPHSNHSDEKRTPEFVAEVYLMIENDLRESIRHIFWKSECLSFLLGVLEANRYF